MKNWGKLAALSITGLIISVFGLSFFNSMAVPVQNDTQMSVHGMSTQDFSSHGGMSQGNVGINSGMNTYGMNMGQQAGMYQPDAQMLQQQQVYAMRLQIEQLKMQIWAMQNMLNNSMNANNMNGNNSNNMNNNSNNMNNMNTSGSGMGSNSGGGMSMM